MNDEDYDIKKITPANQRITGDLTALSKTMQPITKSIFGKKGFIEIDILANWDKIVGDELAQFSAPEKINFPKGEKNNGVLHLQVQSGAFALEIQHREKFILDKINAYFGYNAVSSIKIQQNNFFSFYDEKTDFYNSFRPDLTTNEEKKYIESMTENIKNSKLKEILTKLGQSIFNDNHNKKSKKNEI